MGLLYQFPVEENPLDDRVFIEEHGENERSLHLKTYGLPWMFWGYMVAIVMVLFFMALAIHGPLQAMLDGDDNLNRYLAMLVFATLALIPIVLLCFFFYEKVITKRGNRLTVTKKLFWIPYHRKTYELDAGEGLVMDHFMDSPNMAKIRGRDEMRGFENRGYHELYIVIKTGKRIFLDRNSRPSEIKKMIELLNRY